jgi:hypothetical protein
VRDYVTVDYQVESNLPVGEYSVGRVLLDLAGIDFHKRALELRDQYVADITDLRRAAELRAQFAQQDAQREGSAPA